MHFKASLIVAFVLATVTTVLANPEKREGRHCCLNYCSPEFPYATCDYAGKFFSHIDV